MDTPNAKTPCQTQSQTPTASLNATTPQNTNHLQPHSNLSMPRIPIRLIPLPAVLLRVRDRARVIVRRLGVLVGIALLLRVCGLAGVGRVGDQVVHLRVVGADVFAVALAAATEAALAVLVVDDACVDEEAEEGEADGGERG